MSALNRADNFRGRVAYAASVIARGASHTRSFDNCFENSDGDEVAVAVYRRSLRNPKIAANLPRYLDAIRLGIAVNRLANVPTRELPEQARIARDAAKQRFEKVLAEQQERNNRL